MSGDRKKSLFIVRGSQPRLKDDCRVTKMAKMVTKTVAKMVAKMVTKMVAKMVTKTVAKAVDKMVAKMAARFSSDGGLETPGKVLKDDPIHSPGELIAFPCDASVH